MGADGGTIPTRDEMVRMKKKPEQKDKTAEMNAKWKCCAVTQQTLVPPFMACELGRLYNKEAILELLIDRSQFEGKNLDHIRTMKDVHELNLTDNPGYKKDAAYFGDSYIDHGISPFICPVTGLEMSGKYRFVYLVKCGCVFAERALKVVKTETCNKCGKKFESNDVVILNGSEEEDLPVMQSNMAERKAKAKAEKKAKKKKATTETATSSESKSSTSEDGASSSIKKPCLGAGEPSSSKTNGTIKKSGDQKDAPRPKKAKTIQEDPNASTAYKSLFTTCDKAKNQQKAHWVTFDPCHY